MNDYREITKLKNNIATKSILKILGYNNIQNKLYDGMRHEILNEKESNLVYKDILDFIE